MQGVEKAQGEGRTLMLLEGHKDSLRPLNLKNHYSLKGGLTRGYLCLRAKNQIHMDHVKLNFLSSLDFDTNHGEIDPTWLPTFSLA